jgi:hypothetical protein
MIVTVAVLCFDKFPSAGIYRFCLQHRPPRSRRRDSRTSSGPVLLKAKRVVGK